ncbi:alpha/beta fold hydrolase [Nocardia sp. NPDC052112]|uniref:alpha/beta hydrolase n=1 Tax=Nocardia sp. NPDC052112 TaxID=3155646 RepID=UPI00342DDDC9
MAAPVTINIPIDGEQLHAWWFPPANTNEPAPCVVLAHGFGGIKQMRLGAYAERFAAAGFGALVFDYRHFGDSSGQPRNLLSLTKQFDDWNAAIAAARRRPEVDPDRIALWGSSMSGGMVVKVAAADPRIAAVVSQAPLADGRAALLNTPPAHGLRLLLAGLRDAVVGLWGGLPHTVKAAGHPGDHDAVLATPDAYSGMLSLVPAGVQFDNEVAARVMLKLGFFRPVNIASRLVCPLLVQVMDHDTITPPGPAATIAAAARRGALLAYPGGHFDPYVGSGFERVVPDQITFLTSVFKE